MALFGVTKVWFLFPSVPRKSQVTVTFSTSNIIPATCDAFLKTLIHESITPEVKFLRVLLAYETGMVVKYLLCLQLHMNICIQVVSYCT